ncbi:MAG: Na/Pi cotransporter family protein [Magnetococcales bacterium]|nr:Na/Pi cotransporter family protein [Magnetococcales bacterium]
MAFDKRFWTLGEGIGRRLLLLTLVMGALAFPFTEAIAGSAGGKEMAWGSMAMTLLGGLALFLYGMEQMADALKAVAGDRMKAILAKLTTNRIAGATTGAFVTAIIQSSSVTTVLVVGFITAGLMSMSQALGVIFGANIGTTITAQIVAFKVTKLALLMVAVGFAMSFASKEGNTKQYGFMIMGLGLVFFGMNVMSGAMKPLRSYQPFLDLMVSMESPMVGILIAAAFTGLIQSSSATTGIVIVMASQGFITLPAGIALAFGANIGTCVTALLASIGKPREAVRAALGHILFNTFGVIIWIGLIDPLANFVTMMSPVADPSLQGMEKLAAEVPRQIANAHTVFNVANTILFLPFTNQFAAIINKLLPDRPMTKAEVMGVETKPVYIQEVLLATPSLALDAVRREIKSLGMRVTLMLNDIMPVLLHGDLESLKSIEKRDQEVDQIHAGIIHYLGRISRRQLSREQTQEMMTLVTVVDNLEGVGDLIETNMVRLGEQRLKKGVEVSEVTEANIMEFHKVVSRALDYAIRTVTEEDIEAINKIKEMDEEVEKIMEEAAGHHIQRLSAEAPGRVEAFAVEMDVMDKLRRVFSYAKNISRQSEGFMQASEQPFYSKAAR